MILAGLNCLSFLILDARHCSKTHNSAVRDHGTCSEQGPETAGVCISWTAIPKAFLGSEGPQSVVCEGVFDVTWTKQALKVLCKLSPS